MSSIETRSHAWRKQAIVVTCEYPPFPGGIGTYAGQLVGAVRSLGAGVTVVAPRYEAALSADEADTHRILRHHRISPGAAFRLLRVLAAHSGHGPLLVADIRSVLVVYLTSPIHRRAYRAMIHGSEVSKFKRGSLLFHLVRRAYLRAERLLANSKATLTLFTQSFGCHPRASVTYLGVDPSWFAAPPSNFEDRQLEALPKAARVFCIVGRIEPRKGHLEAVRVLALARDRYEVSEPILVIAGRVEDADYAERVRSEARIQNITLVETGRVSDADLRLLYKNSICQLLIAQDLPGKIEGFGLVLLEAAAQGCPTVATAVGGIPEVLGETGVLCRVDDHAAMAAAIGEFANNGDLREESGSRAKARAQAFNWNACAESTFPELFKRAG